MIISYSIAISIAAVLCGAISVMLMALALIFSKYVKIFFGLAAIASALSGLVFGIVGVNAGAMIAVAGMCIVFSITMGNHRNPPS